jgi:hypothetical protein
MKLDCYDSKNCSNTNCIFGCVSCSFDKICLKCAKGYFKYDNGGQIICLECPEAIVWNENFLIKDLYGYLNSEYICSDCLDQINQWLIRKKIIFNILIKFIF